MTPHNSKDCEFCEGIAARHDIEADMNDNQGPYRGTTMTDDKYKDTMPLGTKMKIALFIMGVVIGGSYVLHKQSTAPSTRQRITIAGQQVRSMVQRVHGRSLDSLYCNKPRASDDVCAQSFSGNGYYCTVRFAFSNGDRSFCCDTSRGDENGGCFAR